MLNENKGFGKKQTSVRLQLNEEIVKELKSIPHWQKRLKAILPELIEDWKLDSCEKVIERQEQLEEKNWYGANASDFVFIGDWGWVANNCGSYETPKYDPEQVQQYIQAGAINGRRRQLRFFLTNRAY